MSWKLGRFAGIDVFLHPTFLLILLLPTVTQGGPAGLLLVLSAFACVLLHEFGHALTARQFGIGTSEITLYPIGGVARLTRMPRSPGAELLITLAGPAVNVAIAAMLFGLFVLDVPEILGIASFAQNLLYFNVGIALFNMVPAFPMDGGRIFRALLSGVVGRVRATEIAAGLGQILAVLFGIFCLTRGLNLEMVPQLFIAAFIFMAAGYELAAVRAEEARRRQPRDPSQGLWFAPPGYHWVQGLSGAWQLVPILVRNQDGPRRPWA
jgi:Zn-dependent protease